MTDEDFVLQTMQRAGLSQAKAIQDKAPDMTGTELYTVEDYIPDFQTAKDQKNMLERTAGFVCRSAAGRVVRLIQPYDSNTYHQEPEELPAQWAFAWSTDPVKALPFIELTTSPYNTGDCCTYAGHIWRSGQDTNTWAPGTIGVKWEDLGPVQAMI